MEDKNSKPKKIILNNIVAISSIDNIKRIELNDKGEIIFIKNFQEIKREPIKNKNKRLEKYIKSIKNENFIIDTKDFHYYYDKKGECIKSNWSGIFENIDYKIFKVNALCKKMTKTNDEYIFIKVELIK